MPISSYSIAASTTQKDTKVDGDRGVIIINDGTADVFFSCDTPTTVVTAGAGGLKSTDPPLSINDTCRVFRVITTSGTATVRVFALK